MLSGKVLTAFGVSVPGALGMLLSLFLGWRLLRAINKSGHLEQRRRP
jgi:hypothetical protein